MKLHSLKPIYSDRDAVSVRDSKFFFATVCSNGVSEEVELALGGASVLGNMLKPHVAAVNIEVLFQ